MHWEKNKNIDVTGTMENAVFSATQKLLALRSQLPMVADYSNIQWLTPHNIHVAAYVRSMGNKRLYCVFNFSGQAAYLTWYAFKETGSGVTKLYDHWSKKEIVIGNDDQYLVIEPYGFYLMETL